MRRRNVLRKIASFGFAGICLASVPGTPICAHDPLPSWNDGVSKQAIISFVRKVTTIGSPDFVPAAERIATFDNDGTLWPEYPVPPQLVFALDRLKQLLPSMPEWKNDPFVKAALDGDASKLLADHYKGLFHIVGLTHAGMTTEEFSAQVKEWMKTARHPRFGRPYDECIYQPMREVLAFLRANGFKTYIVSGGGADFMRVWSERVYGIAPEQVTGSHGQVSYEIRDGKPVLVKTLGTIFLDDREGKPVGIHQIIGRRPIMAFGNSDGDKAMLEYTTIGNPRPSFGLIVHHTDAQREYAYDANPKITGKLIEALAEAPKHGWIVVDMNRDWKFVLSDNSVTAIDVLLEPDATMLKQAEMVNTRLLKAYPKGFRLDETHPPHITLVQGFVHTGDLDKIYAAVDKVLAGANVQGMKLEAVRHYCVPENGAGLASIAIKPTPELIKLQQDLVNALAPFTVETGSSSAFVTTPDDLIINPLLIEGVATYVPKASGSNFNPHVTTGVAARDYLDKMLKEPFEPFNFHPAGVAVYQLGQYGTAARKLTAWRANPLPNI